MERKVILSNLPEFLDEWTLKQLLPCANLFTSFVVNPGDSTKIIVETETRQHALQVVGELNECKLLGSTVQARCVVMDEGVQESGGRMSSGTMGSGFLERVTGDKDYGNVSNEDGTASVGSQRSVLTDAVDVVDTPGAGAVSKIPVPIVANATVLNGERVPLAWTPRPRGCRFCSRDHETYDCKEFAEYFSVSFSEEGGGNPHGFSWPDAAVHKIIDLSAGPVIKLFECTFFKEELSKQEFLVMFAFLTNKLVCYECGTAGHKYNSRNVKQLCQYLPMAVRPTDEIMAKRQSMCKRMLGILRKCHKGKLQHMAATESSNFWKTIRAAKAVKRHAEAESTGSSAAAKRPNWNYN